MVASAGQSRVVVDLTGGKGQLMTPGQVSDVFNVDPKTVIRWHKAGKIAAMKTPGGQHRFYESDVRKFLESYGTPEPAAEADEAQR